MCTADSCVSQTDRSEDDTLTLLDFVCMVCLTELYKWNLLFTFIEGGLFKCNNYLKEYNLALKMFLFRNVHGLLSTALISHV